MQLRNQRLALPPGLLPGLECHHMEEPIFPTARRTSRRIPRIIHQVFIGGKLTPELQANVDALRARNPGWEHRLYDDERAENLIRNVYGEEMLTIYHKISPEYLAARVDLLCNLIIYDAGGVYLDIKSTFERPLDSDPSTGVRWTT